MHQLLQEDPGIQYSLPIVHHLLLCNTICTCTALPHSPAQYNVAATRKQMDFLPLYKGVRWMILLKWCYWLSLYLLSSFVGELHVFWRLQITLHHNGFFSHPSVSSAPPPPHPSKYLCALFTFIMTLYNLAVALFEHAHWKLLGNKWRVLHLRNAAG